MLPPIDIIPDILLRIAIMINSGDFADITGVFVVPFIVVGYVLGFSPTGVCGVVNRPVAVI